jgi:hypothetical protein
MTRLAEVMCCTVKTIMHKTQKKHSYQLASQGHVLMMAAQTEIVVCHGLLSNIPHANKAAKKLDKNSVFAITVKIPVDFAFILIHDICSILHQTTNKFLVSIYWLTAKTTLIKFHMSSLGFRFWSVKLGVLAKVKSIIILLP